MAKRPLGKFSSGIVSGLLTGFAVWFVQYFGFFGGLLENMESASYDWRIRQTTEVPANTVEDIVIVDIDGRSLNKLGAFSQWPRTHWARAIEVLREGGARAIGLDVLFDESRRFPQEDQQFIAATRRQGAVVHAIVLTAADDDNYLYPMSREPDGFAVSRFAVETPDILKYHLNSYERLEPAFTGLLNVARRVGTVNLAPDRDGVSRKIPMLSRFNEHVYPTFALSLFLNRLGLSASDVEVTDGRILVQQADAGALEIPIDDAGQMLVYYHGPFKTFRYVSFSSLILDETRPEFFKDKVVIFGASAPGLNDLREIPWQASYPGVEIHANVLYQLMNGRFLHEWGGLQKFFFLLIVGAFSGVVFSFLRPFGGMIAGITITLLMIASGFVLLAGTGFWLPIVAPIATMLATFMVRYTSRYSATARTRRNIRNLFSNHISPPMVSDLLRKPHRLKLDGERRGATILLAGWASDPDESAVTPEKLVSGLNDYLTTMSKIVLLNKGTLDHYRGSRLQAIFGAPLEIENRALAACRTALAMQTDVQRMAQRLKKKGIEDPQQCIAISSGDVTVGNLGSAILFSYSAWGEAVYRAHDLQKLNGQYETRILLDEKTVSLAGDAIVVREVDVLKTDDGGEERIFELLEMTE